MTIAGQAIPHADTPITLGKLSPDHRAAVRVLAIDDDPSSAKLLALMLGPPVFHCSTAHNGEEALTILRHERFDAVISDLGMPGIGGMALLMQIRPLYPYMAFLLATGVDDVEIGVQAMRCGADDYLVKPLRESAVLASLEGALRKRRLEHEVENYRQHLEEMVAERTGQLQSALKQIEQSYEDTLQ